MPTPRFYTAANPRPRHDAHNPHSRPGQIFVTSMRKLYNPLGFQKGYNVPSFIVGVGALLGFCIARLYYLDFEGVYSKEAIPGEYYWYRSGYMRVGMYVHLVGVLVGGILACFQFVPVIRYKALIFHRINGYIATILLVIGIVGAFIIARHSVGGAMSLQVWVGAVGVLLLLGLILAYVNVKRLQIDQHRAWMLRVWTVAASIVSLRLILLAGLHVIQIYGYVYHQAISCSEIFYMYAQVGVPDARNPTVQLYPRCGLQTNLSGIATGNTTDPATNSGTFVSVSSLGSGPENAASAIRTVFAMAAWLALIIHVLVIEVYLWLTPAEAYRLRQVSYERQVEKGLRAPGAFRDAGITSTTVGDAPGWWSLPVDDYTVQQRLMEPIQAKPRGETPSASDLDGEQLTRFVPRPKSYGEPRNFGRRESSD